MKFLSRPKVALVLPLVVLSVAALVALNELGYQRSITAAEGMVTEQEKRTTLQLLMQHVLDAETGQRGYLLTGDDKYLLPYNAAIAKINPTLDRLRTAYVGDATELGRFAELSRVISRKLGELEVTLKIRTIGGDNENWMQVLRTDLGREYMTTTRDLALDMIETSSNRMKVTQLQIDRSLTISRIGVTLAALLLLA